MYHQAFLPSSSSSFLDHPGTVKKVLVLQTRYTITPAFQLPPLPHRVEGKVVVVVLHTRCTAKPSFLRLLPELPDEDGGSCAEWPFTLLLPGPSSSSSSLNHTRRRGRQFSAHTLLAVPSSQEFLRSFPGHLPSLGLLLTRLWLRLGDANYIFITLFIATVRRKVALVCLSVCVF